MIMHPLVFWVSRLQILKLKNSENFFIRLLEFRNIPHLLREHHQFLRHFIILLLPPLTLLFLLLMVHYHPLRHLRHQNQLHFQIIYFIRLRFRTPLIPLIRFLILQIQTHFKLRFRLILQIQFGHIFLSFIWQVPFFF